MKTIITALFLLIFPTLSLKADLLPVEAFGNLPQYKQAKLSPDGENIAFIREYKESSFIAVFNVKSGKNMYLTKTDNILFKFGWLRWANNKMLLISANYPVHRNGVKYSEARLMKMIVEENSVMESVIKPRRGEYVPQFQDRVVDMLPDEPNFILMEMDLKSRGRMDVYKVDLRSNKKRESVKRGRSHTDHWMTDQQHQVRLGYGRDKTTIFFRLKNQLTGDWQKIWEYEIFDAPDITPLGFGLDPKDLYIRADHQGRYAIFKVNVDDKELPRTLIYSDPNYDIEGDLIYSTKTRDVIGIYHGEAEDSKVYFDASNKAHQKFINKSLPDSHNTISSFSADENRFIVFSSGPNIPGAYYFGDKETNQLEFLMGQYPLLQDKNLKGKHKVTYLAKDGTSIEAYVTLPYAGSPKTNAALVIPHGGPMSRNYAGFDWFSGFFASRGYTIIEPNFRGSSGYGFDFEMASVQQWGGVMQQDLADSANWLLRNYSVDKKKVCILGASYGGYAAMMAGAKNQAEFSCAVSFAGVSDLELLLIKARRFKNYKVVKKQIGSDSDHLEKNSPINFVQDIKIPLLLIHGEDDRVVDVEHSRNMFEELKDLDSEVEYIELPKGNHYLEIEANRLKTLTAMEDFLARHLN